MASSKEKRQPTCWWRRVGVLVLGLSVNTATVIGYDWVVYPYFIWTFGVGPGFLLGIAGSIVLCLGSLWFYDLTREDWLGIETVKALRDVPVKGRIRRFFRRVATRGDPLAFLFLCLKYDAFITTVYMRRRGSHRMTPRDWKIFWGSMLLSNLWWALVVFGAMETFKGVAPSVFAVLQWLGLV